MHFDGFYLQREARNVKKLDCNTQVHNLEKLDPNGSANKQGASVEKPGQNSTKKHQQSEEVQTSHEKTLIVENQSSSKCVERCASTEACRF